MFIPKYFATSRDSMARQLVPRDLYARRGVLALELIDSRLLVFIDTLRKNLGVPITVNGGRFNQSGYRDKGHYGSYKKTAESLSQHRLGRALDFRSSKMTAENIRRHIIENKNMYPMISFLEVGMSGWVHVDCRERRSDDQILYWHITEGFISEEEVLRRGL